MQIEEFRIEVQKALKDERRVTDVAFEPFSDGLELVYFWDGAVRSSFSMMPSKIADKQQLRLAVKASAQSAYDAALKQVEA